MLVRSSAPKAVARALVGVVAVAVLAAGCSSTDDPPASDTSERPSPSPSGPTAITFAVYGSQPVLDAYSEIAARYTLEHPDTKVVVQPYPTHDEAMAAFRAASAQGDPPDLFLMDHDDLHGLTTDKAVRRVDDLLTEREVDFGDGYTRNGLEAFSSDAALQCMPSDVSPLVVYYNPQLIELESIAEPGRRPVTQEDGWSLDEFAAGALQARRPGVRGLYVTPDLEQVAPFVWSGGGDVVDDVDDPTRLTLSEEASAGSVERLLEVVRDPALTFDQAALRKRSALERFKAGKLGMILGFRDLTPVLRAQPGLVFDVMPLPKLSSGATIATMSGLCISSESDQTTRAADFLTEVISNEGAGTLAATGYVMPANLDVVNDEVFLQSGQNPLHADVFGREVRDTRQLPNSPRWPAVRSAAARQLVQLFYQPVILPLQERLEAIDQASVPLFDPSQAPSPSPDPSASPSASPTS
jgi:multiple sugar transport system substrate-binding protein